MGMDVYLHRYQSGRYHFVTGPHETVFSKVLHAKAPANHYKLLTKGDRLVGSIDRVEVDNTLMQALDEIAEGNHLDLDEYVYAGGGDE